MNCFFWKNKKIEYKYQKIIFEMKTRVRIIYKIKSNPINTKTYFKLI